MVLVVDDEASVRQFVRTALEMAGYEVEEAANGEEAWRLLDHHQPELLLTDIVMPGEDGLKLAARAHKRYPQVRAVFMTGYSEQFRDELTGSVCLSKPFSMGTLLSAVESAIGLPHPKTAPEPGS